MLFFQISFEEQWTQNHPQYLSGLSRTLLLTTFLEIAVYCRKTSHEGPFKMSRAVIKKRELEISPSYSKHGPWLLSKENRRKGWKIKVIFIISKWWCQVLFHCTWHTTTAFVIICSQILLVSLMRYDISPVSWLAQVVRFNWAPFSWQL